MSQSATKGVSSYFIDGGFVQVKENVVSLLTDSAQLASTLDPRKAEDELQSVQHRHPKNDAEFAAKDADLELIGLAIAGAEDGFHRRVIARRRPNLLACA